MKNTKLICRIIGISGITALALALVSGCVVRVRPYGEVVAPAPAVSVDVGVPDDYYWDGYEYVGLVGGAYFYLGPGNVWVRCEPWRVDRFRGWQRDHPDWHTHVVRNDRYRNDSHGHYQPRRDEYGH